MNASMNVYLEGREDLVKQLNFSWHFWNILSEYQWCCIIFNAIALL